MALFNRKKEDAPAPTASGTDAKPLTSEAFDFDAISRDLDAQNGASSFDSLLSQPATPAGTATTKKADSAFDFPENDPLGLSSPSADVPPANAPVRPNMAVPTTPDTVMNAPLAAPALPATGVAPLESAPVVAPTGVTRLKGKKSTPLIPILGALGLIAVVGGGAMLFLHSNKGDTETEAPPAPSTSLRPAQNAAPARPDGATAPSTPGAAAPGAPSAPVAGLRSASPGIAPPTLPVAPIKGASNVPVRVAQNPATPARPAGATAPAATQGTDPALASRLKALWQAGADAKHRDDVAGARKAWQQALQLAPGHPGFQESINKLAR